jgi:hydrogenase maturation protease
VSELPSGRHELLILGLGNVLCGDDGLGVAAVEELNRDYAAPEGVQILDGGTLGLALLGWATDAERLLLVDAIQADLPPGSLVRLAGDEVGPAVRDRLSVHQIGVADLLDSMELIGRTPPSVSLLGMVPASLELMTELTPAVLSGLPALVAAVVEEAAQSGFALIPRRDVA